MEAAVTDWDSYAPYPSEYPPDEWSTGRHHRSTPEQRPPAPSAGTGTARWSRTAAPQPDVEDDEEEVVELRNQVVDRLQLMNARHGLRAWERANTDPIAPHGLAFLYTDHDPQRSTGHRQRICTATRLFLDDADTASLPRLLQEQTRIADGYRRAGTFDPRTQLANRAESMTEFARYYGVGVSTVDLPNFPWTRQRQSQNGYNIMGACFALLADGTWLLLHRGLPGQYSALRIWSSKNLDSGPSMNLRRWNWGRDLPQLADPATRDIWTQLQALHRILDAGSPGAGYPGVGHGR
jgi:hypothetical protein